MLPRRIKSSPKRIQRKRTKGWKMPEGAIYVGRPTAYGNPFTYGTAQEKVDNYRDLLAIGKRTLGAQDFSDLRGHDLACWCPLDQPCHADVLLELANK